MPKEIIDIWRLSGLLVFSTFAIQDSRIGSKFKISQYIQLSMSKAFKGLIFSTGMKILNPGSGDISQKLRLTKCLHTFQDLKAEIYNYTKKRYLALGNLAKFVFWSILLFKNWSFSKLLNFFCVSFSGENWVEIQKNPAQMVLQKEQCKSQTSNLTI